MTRAHIRCLPPIRVESRLPVMVLILRAREASGEVPHETTQRNASTIERGNQGEAMMGWAKRHVRRWLEAIARSWENRVTREFHTLYYNGRRGGRPIFMQTSWMGHPYRKSPLDAWAYQELMTELKPELVVETGTFMGGSALFIAHLMDILGKGQVLTIDIEEYPRPAHPRIQYVRGSSTDPGLLQGLLRDRPPGPCMVILDSDHRKDHVLLEMELLGPYVTLGSYLIVEDTNINGHPVFPTHGPGPYEAVAEFLGRHDDFEVDSTRESKFLLTFNPRGYLKRIREAAPLDREGG